jgi:DNA polymerase-2
MTRTRGFILQASYRIQADERGLRRPVVHLYGRLESEQTFLVRDDRQRPRFFIRCADADRARALRLPEPLPTDLRDFTGMPVCAIEVPTPADVPPLRDRLHAAGIDTFEADVRFASRYLIERGIKGGVEIDGLSTPGTGIDHVFTNPHLTPASVTPALRVLSFDIETDGKAQQLLAISLYAPGIDEVLIVDPLDRPMPERAIRCANEYSALEAFCERVREFDPDILTGWNVIDFDLTVLQRIAARVRHPLRLGRDDGALQIRPARGYFGSGQASIPGRVVLDGIDLLRGAFIRMEEYSLDAVAQAVLGEGKAVMGSVRDRIGEILHNYSHDLPAFALYARTDARLAWQILEQLRLIPLAMARSQLTGMTPDRVAASIASFDFLYLRELWQRRVVAPSVGNDDRAPVIQQGGHVLEPRPGLYRHVWVFDFKSLYPSIIRTFNIDPLTYVDAPDAHADLIQTPAAAFRRDPGILPQLLDTLFPQREAARQSGDAIASQAIKILMNSFYGVLGTPACRFFNPALANAITGTGREMLLWSKAWFEAAGFVVLYGDTDSLFVQSPDASADAAQARGKQLATQLTAELARHIDHRWQRTSRLELKFEKLYLRFFLPSARHSTRGASKRYVGLLQDASTERVEFVGMEVVRRDWTALARQVQRELYERLFSDRDVDDYIAGIVRQVRAGEFDSLLVYRKNLRKDVDDYTATTPPHVAAARKSSQSEGSLISYVMTVAGAEPIDNVTHALDREHYVQKQIRPVAEPVLNALGLNFAQLTSAQQQLDLYS